jgi:hypothetical protein
MDLALILAFCVSKLVKHISQLFQERYRDETDFIVVLNK